MTAIVGPQYSGSPFGRSPHVSQIAASLGMAASHSESQSQSLGTAQGSYGRPRRSKAEVCEAFVQNLQNSGAPELQDPSFLASIRHHFERLPTRYALDVNISDAMDVLTHKRLLDEARQDPSTVSFAVRPVEVVLPRHRSDLGAESPVSQGTSQRGARAIAQQQHHSKMLQRPAFGSSPNLQALALEAGRSHDDDFMSGSGQEETHLTFYEITIASVDQPKLLSRLSEALGDLGLNIREAHAFNTVDRFSLDVFVVDQWEREPDSTLEELLGQRLQHVTPPLGGPGRLPNSGTGAIASSGFRIPEEPPPHLAHLMGDLSSGRPGSPAVDDWEIDITQLQIDTKIASGAFSNLYRGSYCGQEVAVKILKDVQDDTSQFQEFLQEVSIMRKVRHKNVVQFIGACTRKPNLCIVFEFMSGGSIYDYVRREGPFKLSQVLKVAVEVSKGMDYLHQRKIIHRDLKAANLLLDENQIVKIADFGVARIIENGGGMTAETGTYRWMAPEVIEHKPYDEKADVFSFGVVLWEVLTCKVPYNDMTPLQAAVGVVQKGLRPSIPPTCPQPLAEIMSACWAASPVARPSFRELTPRLQQLLEAVRDEESRKTAIKPGLLSKLRGK